MALRDRLTDASTSQLAPAPAEGARVGYLARAGAEVLPAEVVLVNNMSWCVWCFLSVFSLRLVRDLRDLGRRLVRESGCAEPSAPAEGAGQPQMHCEMSAYPRPCIARLVDPPVSPSHPQAANLFGPPV